MEQLVTIDIEAQYPQAPHLIPMRFLSSLMLIVSVLFITNISSFLLDIWINFMIILLASYVEDAGCNVKHVEWFE